ncbi:MAG: hypothetical protein ABI467_00995 [Kofleriaceae bacterium]
MRCPRIGLVFAVAVAAGCGVRAPAPLEVAALVAKRGPVEARRELAIRILAEPRDVQARLAAAELDDRLGRPSDAIEQLEAVERLGGPIGTRWHDRDRARFGKLLAARGRVRLAREAGSALADLERARTFGAVIAAGELSRARAAKAVAELRHVDADVRAHGQTTLAELATDPAWAGARPHASPAEHGAFGAWLWARGANREAYDQLVVWHDGVTHASSDGAAPLGSLEDVYAQALAWWSPTAAVAALSRPAPPFVPPVPAPPSGPGEPAGAPAVELRDPRVAAVTAFARARLVAILEAGHTGTHAAQAPARPDGSPELAGTGITNEALDAVAAAFARDPAVAERLGRELVARAVDRALGEVAIGALFDALGDPARARSAWLAASADSDEPAIVAGYAAAAARTGDGDAALVIATGAAAASGDPAATWIDIARALLRGHRALDALTAMRTAMGLAGANTLATTLDLAIEASREVGRDDQAARLAAERAPLSPPPVDHAAQQGELAALRQHAPNASALAAAWVATRDDPRDIELRAALLAALEPGDPRRAAVARELVVLSADRDPDRALGAALALQAY